MSFGLEWKALLSSGFYRLGNFDSKYKTLETALMQKPKVNQKPLITPRHTTTSCCDILNHHNINHLGFVWFDEKNKEKKRMNENIFYCFV